MTHALAAATLILLVALLAAVASARPLAARADNVCADASLMAYPDNLDRVGKAIVCELNLQRSAAALPPLREDPRLDRSSQFQSDDMVTSHFLAHEEPGHPTLLSRIRRTGYFHNVTGGLFTENISVAPQEEADASDVVEAWMESPEHRDKILYTRFRDVGVGSRVTGPDPVFYPDRSSVVFTTDFGRRYYRHCTGAGALRRCKHRRTHR